MGEWCIMIDGPVNTWWENILCHNDIMRWKTWWVDFLIYYDEIERYTELMAGCSMIDETFDKGWENENLE